MSKFTYFWRSASPFSQWHKANFTVDGIEFNCAEQYMMYRKAMLFNDAEVAAKVLKTSDPSKHKQLGRQVKGFDKNVWNAAREQIVYTGNHAKFTQNPALLEKLMATAGTILVEASPVDEIWGIGLSEEAAVKVPPEQWPGLNLLGKVLTRLRDNISACNNK